MKIRYKVITKQIDVEPYGLIKNISSSLTERGYTIYDINSKEIKFRYNIWQFGSRANTLNKIDGGEFVIDASMTKKITFSYYTSPTIEILAIFASLYFILFIDYLFVIFIAFTVFFFLLRLVIAKNIAHGLIDSLLQSPNSRKY